MKKKRFVWAAMLACLAFTACEIQSKDGDWEPMKWSHPKYETVKVDGTNYYMVPVDGGSYGFRCKNYVPWLSNHRFEADDIPMHAWQDSPMEDQWHHYHNEWCSVDAVKDSVIVTFSANNGRVRKAIIEVTAGDIFDSFKFLQQSAIYTDQAK